MTEKDIIEYAANLGLIAVDIKIKLDLVAQKNVEQLELEQDMETIRYGALSEVLTARFEINNKLMFTNDDQRKIAVGQILSTDANYLAAKSARNTKVYEQSMLMHEVEFLRRHHEAVLTVLLYFANAVSADSMTK